MGFGLFGGALVVLALVVLFNAIKLVPQGREFTVERFGKYTRTLKPGLSFLTPFVEGIGRRMNMMSYCIYLFEKIPILKIEARSERTV